LGCKRKIKKFRSSVSGGEKMATPYRSKPRREKSDENPGMALNNVSENYDFFSQSLYSFHGQFT